MSPESASHSPLAHGPESPAAALFDAVGAGYETAFADLPEQLAALDWLIAELGPGSKVLDIGSGTGRPTAERLVAAGHRVTGIDVSATMVELARERVPGATFEQLDARDLVDDDGAWDAVCAFFAFLQLPRADLDAQLDRLGARLAPGGLLAFATVPAEADGVEIEWLGHRARVTSHGAEELLVRLRAAGLEMVHHGVSVFQPNHPAAGPEEQLFVHARKSVPA
ncbi:class I SAM-dependent DNA methyltransferase [Embleya scabrispora]|uniref:class I SAM-dependent DNA methyltransferase n=1 Tax=Embleya scabrispora TaxID=159449 RepID=UPI0003675048|nr:class I SAM-dependent methyltransferase [Embleya scabrispora]MYS87322.1 methyltransferase domain-containing protein [Streptomyces sp. SID5474]